MRLLRSFGKSFLVRLAGVVKNFGILFRTKIEFASQTSNENFLEVMLIYSPNLLMYIISRKYLLQGLAYLNNEFNSIFFIWAIKKQPFPDVLQNVANFTGKHQCWSFFLIKLFQRLQHRCFPVKFATFLKNTIFYRTPKVAASGNFKAKICLYYQCFDNSFFFTYSHNSKLCLKSDSCIMETFWKFFSFVHYGSFFFAAT